MHPISEALNDKKLEPVELARWLEERAGRIRERWLADVQSRDSGWSPQVAELTTEFFALFLDMLPHGLGPYKDHVEPIWLQTAELFGSMAAKRGLAAGEVIEEFQLLRDAVIRFLYAEPPVAGPLRISLRDLLRVNRFVDRGVTQASVGHTDALFFALINGTGVQEGLTSQTVGEMRAQLEVIRAELAQVARALQRR